MTGATLVAAPLPEGLTAPVGHYSVATIANGLILVSGLLAMDDAGAVIGVGDAGVQARCIFAALQRILQAAGSDLGQVAKLNLYLLSLQDRAAINDARKAAFGSWKPASTLVQVAGLIGEGALVEIDAVAVMGTAQHPQDRL
jgi:2-iminobutanoate/2-iminopropanoate deaminase